MKVSMVSVSRRAAPPQRGQVTLTNSGTFSSGERPVPVISMRSGSSTGSWSSGTGTTPHAGQWITGIGRAPIALARDAPVLDAEGDGGLAEAVLCGVGGHLAARFFAGQAGPRAGVFHDAVVR